MQVCARQPFGSKLSARSPRSTPHGKQQPIRFSRAAASARTTVVSDARRGRGRSKRCGRKRRRGVDVLAAANVPGSSGPGLVRFLVNAPKICEKYLDKRWWRKPLWYAISFSFAFFASNTVSLSFGARNVNDVVASSLMVVFYEVSSRVVYRSEKRTVWHNILNCFKLGVVIGFLMDSYKLGG